jgi:hypothetical protein
MSEFNNRIDAQRQILGVVNGARWRGESLLGLSGKALERWVSRNGLDPEGPLPLLLRTAAADLFFLANRSQEQVSEEYQARSRSLHNLIKQIAGEVAAAAECSCSTRKEQ